MPLAFAPAAFMIAGQVVCWAIRGDGMDDHGVEAVGNLLFWVGFAAVFAAPAAIVWTDQEDSTLYGWLAVVAGIVALIVAAIFALSRICVGECFG